MVHHKHKVAGVLKGAHESAGGWAPCERRGVTGLGFAKRTRAFESSLVFTGLQAEALLLARGPGRLRLDASERRQSIGDGDGARG